jgi:hypothetical protein
MIIAFFGQWEAHTPHPLQEAEMVSAFFPFVVCETLMAL